MDRNKGLDLRPFWYQLTEEFGDWMELLGILRHLENAGAVYGEDYIVKRDRYKRDCKWGIWTLGEGIDRDYQGYRDEGPLDKETINADGFDKCLRL